MSPALRLIAMYAVIAVISAASALAAGGDSRRFYHREELGVAEPLEASRV